VAISQQVLYFRKNVKLQPAGTTDNSRIRALPFGSNLIMVFWLNVSIASPCFMNDIYNNKSYLSNNPTWHEEDAPFKAGKIIELLARNPIAFKTVAEVGCGSGEILVQLQPQLPSETIYFGFDISKDSIAIAKKKETDKIKFEVRDISSENENCFYDLLLVIDVIEHIDNYFKFLAGIAYRSQYTIFHIPLDMCVWSLFREQMLIESKDRVGHIHNFTEDFIKSILSGYGFEIIDQLYTEPTFESLTYKQKVVNVFRKFMFRINKRVCTKTLGGYSILLLTKNTAAVR
jgi:predicted RNA methylase